MRTTFTAILVVSLFASSARAQITIVNQVEGWMGATKSNITTTEGGATLLSYDATGVDKLVFAIGSESGFNNQKITITGATFNGDALTQAVQNNFAPPANVAPFSNDGGTAAIWYLDNPDQTTGTLTVSYTTTGGGPNGGLASIVGLSGTLPGVGNTGNSWTSQVSPGNVSTSLTTTADDSWVLALLENSGAQSGAGFPTALAPLTQIDNGEWGSQWGSYATGYQFVASSGTLANPTFLTNAGGSIHVVAAEFLAAPVAAVPEPVSIAIWSLVGLGLVGFGYHRIRRKK